MPAKSMEKFGEVLKPHETVGVPIHTLEIAKHHLGGMVREMVNRGMAGEILENASNRLITAGATMFQHGVEGKRIDRKQLGDIIRDFRREGIIPKGKKDLEIHIRAGLMQIHGTGFNHFDLLKKLEKVQ